MSYYLGDYYAQGDPGFFDKLKGLVGLGASFIPGVGGVVGRVIAGAGKVGSKAGAIIAKHPAISAAGAAGTVGVIGGGTAMHKMGGGMPGAGLKGMGGAGMPGARGYHMSKPHKGVPPHMVRNRRMRVTNPRALRRAIRRAKGFERLARKVMHFTSTRRHSGRAVFRSKRRR